MDKKETAGSIDATSDIASAAAPSAAPSTAPQAQADNESTTKTVISETAKEGEKVQKESAKIEAAEKAEKASSGKKNDPSKPTVPDAPLVPHLCPATDAALSESWVACDKCEKWRRLTEGSLAQYEDKAFHCTYLPGIDCNTPEEVYEEPTDGGTRTSKTGKARLVFCSTCNLALERGGRGREKASNVLERHYSMHPVCRPLEETTPATVASRIIDLSDRLPYRAVVRSDLPMWEKFTARARGCKSYRDAAEEVLWLFRQLKSSVLNHEWLATLPNGIDDFVAKCVACTEKTEARELVQQLEFDSINWVQVHKLWALERPSVAPVADGGVEGGAAGSHSTSSTCSSWTASQKKRDKPAAVQSSRGGSTSAPKWKRHKDDKEEGAGGGGVGGGGRARTSSMDKDELDDDLEDASFSSSENAWQSAGGRGGGSPTKVSVTLGSLVQVRLDDDTTALAIVSDVPRNNLNNNKGVEGERYEVTFMDDQGRLALRDRLELSLPNEFVDVVFECDPMYMQVLPAGWIPVPLETGMRFVGPQGQLVSTVDQVLNDTATSIPS